MKKVRQSYLNLHFKRNFRNFPIFYFVCVCVCVCGGENDKIILLKKENVAQIAFVSIAFTFSLKALRNSQKLGSNEENPRDLNI